MEIREFIEKIVKKKIKEKKVVLKMLYGLWLAQMMDIMQLAYFMDRNLCSMCR